jgi:outer membrane protein assembly factor BamE (lipoprotein component of BamABCDE complex)
MKAIPPARPPRHRTAALALSALLPLLAAAGGCAPTVSNHGHRLDMSVVDQIRPGETSREQVARLLGSPSAVGTFGDKSWYYVAQRTERMTFYQENVAAQDVLRIDFDERGLVSGVSRRGLEMARAVDPADEKTRTLGNELTIVQQFVGNIGRFNSDPNATARSAATRPGRAPGSGGGTVGGF